MTKPIVFRDELAEWTLEPIPEGVDPHQFLQQAMDDCPLCQEARARGEVPLVGTLDDLDLGPEPRARSPLFSRPPRWRTRKRG